jgi:hypothetical protein
MSFVWFSRPADSELTLGFLYELLCFLKVRSQRVKEPLAVLLNVNLMLGHGLDDDAGLFHGLQYGSRFARFPEPPTELALDRKYRKSGDGHCDHANDHHQNFEPKIALHAAELMDGDGSETMRLKQCCCMPTSVHAAN